MCSDSSPEGGRGLSVDSESYDRSYACGNEDARQHSTSGAAAAIKSLEAQLAKAHSAGAAAVAERNEMRTEHRQMSLAESSFMKTATSETAAARDAKASAVKATSLLKDSRAELAGVSTRLRKSESDAQ